MQHGHVLVSGIAQAVVARVPVVGPRGLEVAAAEEVDEFLLVVGDAAAVGACDFAIVKRRDGGGG